MEEYGYRFRAYQLQQIDKEHDMHLQAWLNHSVTTTKEHGNKQVPVYLKFEDFFNYKKRLREVEQTKRQAVSPEMRKLARIAAKVNAEGR